MNGFTLLFAAALAVSAGVRLWLAQRQRRFIRRHRDEVPPAFREWISLDAHRFAADYAVAQVSLERVDIVYAALLALGWTVGGGIELLQGLWQGTGLNPFTAGVGLLVSAVLLTAVLDLPLSIYRTFVVEQRFGFNRMTPALFVTDLAKQGLLLVLLGTPLAAAILALMEGTGALWWLLAWVLWIAFTGLLVWAYPTLIAPLFNRFLPLEDEALRQRIARLLQECGFASRGVFVTDGSRRSGHGNAYFTGLGRSKRIVFFDTLLASLDADEVEAVLAHELGHYARGHVRKHLLFSGAASFVGFALLGWVAGQGWFYHGLGVAHASAPAALLLFLFVAPVFGSAARPLTSRWMRKHEFEADEFAARHTDARHLVHALVKLYAENAVTVTPDPLYSAYHDSHPPAPVRIARLSGAAAASR